MSAVRTQIYLTEEQRRRIDRVAVARGLTMAQVVRRAVDEYLVDEPDPSQLLASTFGADADAATPSRDSWNRG